MVVLSKINKPIGTSMASFKPVFLFILVCFINFLATKAWGGDTAFDYSCSLGNTTTPNSAFQLNVRTLFSYLSSNATANKEFYNTTVSGRNPSDTVYGMFMCRGDVPPQLCSQCVTEANHSVFSERESDCSLSKEVLFRNEECMVRYSNNSFFSTTDFRFLSASGSPVNVSNQASFERLVSETMNQVADEAANSSIGVKKYATMEARISGFQTLYCLAQCIPDLSPQDCRHCLNVTALQQEFGGSMVKRIEYYSCNMRYDVYPFYRPSNAPAPSELVPASNTDSKYSPDPAYLSHNCTNSEIMNNAFLSNLKTLLSYLSSNATTKTGFFKTTVDGTNPSDTVHGLFMCRGDVFPTHCQLCVQDATERISSECPSSQEAIIWYDHCLLRYSHRSLLSTVDTSPKFHHFNMGNTSNPNLLQSFFTWTLAGTLSEVETETGDSTIKNYRTRSVKLNDHQTLYTLGQCMPDLPDRDCSTCLDNIFKYEIPWCCLASPEGKVLYPSCYIMFGLSQFYRDGDEADEAFRQASPPPTTKENIRGRSRTMIVVVPIVLSVLLLSFCCYLLWKKARKSGYKTLILRKNFGGESTTLKGLQFDLARIKAATNNFSHENKIGKGGFGEVYKGILPDGRHIAVKRLSTSSKQGLVEFKNEILLIAKLQQRNLVALIGFCLEEQEKILIYEYVPNRSLDYFLFGTQQQKLSWSERYKIIGGTALGILYLHDYSRLKVIHRDLKPSNVLLDENMNPKISDFGMARIVEIDQDCGNTNKIAGTFGYMSPEYAMLGQFSEKSDIFSFGVMVLEIITGKRIINPYESHHIAEGLISYVWRQWKNQTPLSILDPNMKENYSQIEVIKCIHIGLLCVQENPNVRPTMAKVVSYLNSHTRELPSPQEPAFFIHGRMNREVIAPLESSSGQSTNSLISFSVNDMSKSELYPRQ